MAKIKIRFNHLIRVPEVRLIDEEGAQLGVMSTRKAYELAQDRGLDLVEVSPNANPPVCKILDYGRYAYELQKKTRENKKRKARSDIKEVQFRPKIGQHDYDFKMRNAAKFLKSGDKVKFVCRFRGRENAHPEVGEELLRKAADDLKEIGVVEMPPRKEGRIIVMMLGPSQAVLSQRKIEREKSISSEQEQDEASSPDAYDEEEEVENPVES